MDEYTRKTLQLACYLVFSVGVFNVAPDLLEQLPVVIEAISTAVLTLSVGIGDGNSMQPQIYECDLMIYYNNGYENAEEGDTIVFTGQDRVVAHEYQGSGLAKGINNGYVDPVPITKDNYKGKVQFVIGTSKLC